MVNFLALRTLGAEAASVGSRFLLPEYSIALTLLPMIGEKLKALSSAPVQPVKLTEVPAFTPREVGEFKAEALGRFIASETLGRKTFETDDPADDLLGAVNLGYDQDPISLHFTSYGDDNIPDTTPLLAFMREHAPTFTDDPEGFRERLLSPEGEDLALLEANAFIDKQGLRAGYEALDADTKMGMLEDAIKAWAGANPGKGSGPDVSFMGSSGEGPRINPNEPRRSVSGLMIYPDLREAGNEAENTSSAIDQLAARGYGRNRAFAAKAGAIDLMKSRDHFIDHMGGTVKRKFEEPLRKIKPISKKRGESKREALNLELKAQLRAKEGSTLDKVLGFYRSAYGELKPALERLILNETGVELSLYDDYVAGTFNPVAFKRTMLKARARGMSEGEALTYMSQLLFDKLDVVATTISMAKKDLIDPEAVALFKATSAPVYAVVKPRKGGPKYTVAPTGKAKPVIEPLTVERVVEKITRPVIQAAQHKYDHAHSDVPGLLDRTLVYKSFLDELEFLTDYGMGNGDLISLLQASLTRVIRTAAKTGFEHVNGIDIRDLIPKIDQELKAGPLSTREKLGDKFNNTYILLHLLNDYIPFEFKALSPDELSNGWLEKSLRGAKTLFYASALSGISISSALADIIQGSTRLIMDGAWQPLKLMWKGIFRMLDEGDKEALSFIVTIRESYLQNYKGELTESLSEWLDKVTLTEPAVSMVALGFGYKLARLMYREAFGELKENEKGFYDLISPFAPGYTRDLHDQILSEVRDGAYHELGGGFGRIFNGRTPEGVNPEMFFAAVRAYIRSAIFYNGTFISRMNTWVGNSPLSFILRPLFLFKGPAIGDFFTQFSEHLMEVVFAQGSRRRGAGGRLAKAVFIGVVTAIIVKLIKEKSDGDSIKDVKKFVSTAVMEAPNLAMVGKTIEDVYWGGDYSYNDAAALAGYLRGAVDVTRGGLNITFGALQDKESDKEKYKNRGVRQIIRGVNTYVPFKNVPGIKYVYNRYLLRKLRESLDSNYIGYYAVLEQAANSRGVSLNFPSGNTDMNKGSQ